MIYKLFHNIDKNNKSMNNIKISKNTKSINYNTAKDKNIIVIKYYTADQNTISNINLIIVGPLIVYKEQLLLKIYLLINHYIHHKTMNKHSQVIFIQPSVADKALNK